jgi:lysophospholipase L1-like esterase
MLVGEAEDLRAKANGKRLDTHPTPAGYEEMAELVEEDDDSQNKQKSHDCIKHHVFRTFESKEFF